MTHVLTLVASKKPLNDAHLKTAHNIIGKTTNTPSWLEKNKAADLFLVQKPNREILTKLRKALHTDAIDVFTLPIQNRRKKLLLADMDSTIVPTETLDELANFAGIKDQIAAITQKAMEGKLDFHAALKERVGLLKNLSATTLDQTLAETVLNPGAKQLVTTMKKHGATCVLVSGGFTFFTSAIAKQSGFDHHHGNILEIENSKFTGTVTEPVLDKQAKLDFLNKYVVQLNLTPDDVMSIGDGANDLPMLKAAGFGVGFHAKGIVAAEIDNLVVHGDLTAPLYAQGYSGL